MDEHTFKKLMDEALAPIQNDLVDIKQAQVKLQDAQAKMQDDQVKLQDAQARMQDTLDNQILPSITETELTVKSYKVSYQENQRNIERLDTRLNTVEDELAIDPPEDLKVPHFAE